MRVLVIDDDASIRSMLQMVLGLEGFEVRCAENGREGLAAVREFEPDVLVLDVMMPDLDGHEVATLLREDPHTRQLPIVMCTARASVDDQWAGWQLGIDSYVAKPFDSEDLLAELLRVTAARASQHSAAT